MYKGLIELFADQLPGMTDNLDNKAIILSRDLDQNRNERIEISRCDDYSTFKDFADTVYYESNGLPVLFLRKPRNTYSFTDDYYAWNIVFTEKKYNPYLTIKNAAEDDISDISNLMSSLGIPFVPESWPDNHIFSFFDVEKPPVFSEGPEGLDSTLSSFFTGVELPEPFRSMKLNHNIVIGEVIINESGAVKHAELSKISGINEIDSAANKALSHLREKEFIPARHRGRNVSCRIAVFFPRNIIIGKMPTRIKYSDEQIARFAQNDSLRGAIVIPLSDYKFCIVDNDFVHDRLYYDYYFDKYDSYHDFLIHLLNKPWTIDVSKCGITNYKIIDWKIQSEAISDFSSFLDKYTEQVKDDASRLYRGIRKKYSEKAWQIARICSLKGLYIFPPECFSGWTITSQAEFIPPDEL